MKRIHILALALCVLCFSGPGCKKNVPQSTNASDSKGKSIKLAIVTNTKNEFWITVRHGCNSAAQNLGNVDLDFRFFTGSTVAEQNKILSDLVAEGVQGIAVSPIDAQKQTDFLNQIAAKTLLICVDSDATNSKRAFFIGTDNVTAGKQAADLLKAALPKGGKVMVFVGYPKAQNAIDRMHGLTNELAGSNIQIIGTLADATKPDVAEQNAKAAMAKHPDLAGMLGLYSYDGPAILRAVRNAGKAGQVKIVCFDDDAATLDGIAAGDIYGTVVQIPTRIGYETVSRMAKYLSGDKTQLSRGEILFKSIAVNKTLVPAMQTWRQDKLQP